MSKTKSLKTKVGEWESSQNSQNLAKNSIIEAYTKNSGSPFPECRAKKGKIPISVRKTN
jgi:hypothetical protein